MDDWKGFSDKELQVLQQSQEIQNSHPPLSRVIRQKNPNDSRKKNPSPNGNKKSPLKRNRPNPETSAEIERQRDIDREMVNHAEQRLASPPRESQRKVHFKKSNSDADSNTKDSNDNLSENKVSTKQPDNITELPANEGLSRDVDSLTKVQIQQKIMEEQNRKKKALLSEAIKTRQQKAKAESNRLRYIQSELNQLDQMLNTDVSILRNRIEEASREYLEAQKRYEKAEHEFVASKCELHRTLELKEQLTEHLYTIIHQNETRKAQKLVEMMEKLDVEQDSLIDQVVESSPSQILVPPPPFIPREMSVPTSRQMSVPTSSQEIPALNSQLENNNGTDSKDSIIINSDENVKNSSSTCLENDAEMENSKTKIESNVSQSTVGSPILPSHPQH